MTVVYRKYEPIIMDTSLSGVYQVSHKNITDGGLVNQYMCLFLFSRHLKGLMKSRDLVLCHFSPFEASIIRAFKTMTKIELVL
jgi:hypothetical protein